MFVVVVDEYLLLVGVVLRGIYLMVGWERVECEFYVRVVVCVGILNEFVGCVLCVGGSGNIVELRVRLFEICCLVLFLVVVRKVVEMFY